MGVAVIDQSLGVDRINLGIVFVRHIKGYSVGYVLAVVVAVA